MSEPWPERAAEVTVREREESPAEYLEQRYAQVDWLRRRIQSLRIHRARTESQAERRRLGRQIDRVQVWPPTPRVRVPPPPA